VRLLDAEDFARVRLREAALLYDLADLQCQASLQQLLLRVWWSEIDENVAAASFALVLLMVSSTFACGATPPIILPAFLIAIIKSSSADSQL
jgi:hypothetical protein